MILDNAPGRLQHICDMHPDAEVVYLPLSTTQVQVLSTTAAWEGVTQQGMNGIWKKVLETHVNTLKGLTKLLLLLLK